MSVAPTESTVSRRVVIVLHSSSERGRKFYPMVEDAPGRRYLHSPGTECLGFVHCGHCRHSERELYARIRMLPYKRGLLEQMLRYPLGYVYELGSRRYSEMINRLRNEIAETEMEIAHRPRLVTDPEWMVEL